jgi:hypothetical protein
MYGAQLGLDASLLQYTLRSPVVAEPVVLRQPAIAEQSRFMRTRPIADRAISRFALRVASWGSIGMSSTHTYIVPLAMLTIALMLIAAASLDPL